MKLLNIILVPLKQVLSIVSEARTQYEDEAKYMNIKALSKTTDMRQLDKLTKLRYENNRLPWLLKGIQHNLNKSKTGARIRPCSALSYPKALSLPGL